MSGNSLINNINFYKNRKVLITGHTGFKGAWMTAMLNYLKVDALGYSLSPVVGGLYEQINGNSLIKNVNGDLLDSELLNWTIQKHQPEIVIHLAAFGFVKECFDDPVRAYQTNLMGSVNLLEAVRKCDSVRSVLLISTDKVYENKGDGAIYSEEDPLGGNDSYASSKTCMEIMVRDYRENYFHTDTRITGIATARASNVLGGGDHIQTRLIPTILRAVDSGTTVEIRNPEQTRPWQSVLDAVNGYLTIARYLYKEPLEYTGAWNVGPTRDGIRSVSWVLEKIQKSFRNLKGQVGNQFYVHESDTLGLDIRKALGRLDWEPQMTCDVVIEKVVEFYLCQKAGQSAADICFDQIDKFFREVI